MQQADGEHAGEARDRFEVMGFQELAGFDTRQTWSASIPLTTDAHSGDRGYSSTVEYDDGTAWYELLKDSPLTPLRQTRWRLKG